MKDTGSFLFFLTAISLGLGVLFYLAYFRLTTTILATSLLVLPAMLSIGLERNPSYQPPAPLPAVLLLLGAGAAGGAVAGGLGCLLSRRIRTHETAVPDSPRPGPNPVLILSWGLVADSLFAPAAEAVLAGGASFAFLAPDPCRLVLMAAFWGIVMSGFRGPRAGLLQLVAFVAALVLLLIGLRTITSSPHFRNVALAWGWLGMAAGLLGVAACSLWEFRVRPDSASATDPEAAARRARLVAIVLAGFVSALFLMKRSW